MENLTTGFITTLFDWIWTSSLLVVVIVGFILAVKHLFKNKLPIRWHYLLWFIIVVRLLVPWTPESSFSLFNWLPTMSSEQSLTELAPIHPYALVDEGVHNQGNTAATSSASDLAHPSNSADPSTSYTNAVGTTEKTNRLIVWDASLSLYEGLFYVWFLGVLFMTCKFISLNYTFRKQVIKDAITLQDQATISILEQCKQQLNIKRHIPVLLTNQVKSPALYRCLRPHILLPRETIAAFDANEWRYMFLHELIHYKRKDLLVNGLMSTMLVLHWFNPIIWYSYRRMQEDQELSCDDRAISYLRPDEVKAYGYTVIKQMKISSNPSSLIPVTYFRSSSTQIKRRIHMIALFKQRSARWTIVGATLFVLIAAATLTSAKPAIKSADKPVISPSANLDLLKPLKPDIRKQAEASISYIMERLEKSLPLQKVTHLPEQNNWFLEFGGDRAGHQLLWINQDTGKIARAEFGVELSANAVSKALLEETKQLLEQHGDRFTSNMYFHRHLSYDATKEQAMNFSTSLRTKGGVITPKVTLNWANDKLNVKAYPVPLDQVETIYIEQGKLALQKLSGKEKIELQLANRYESEETSHLYLYFNDDRRAYFNLNTKQLYYVEDATERRSKSAVTQQKIHLSALTVVEDIFGTNLQGYTFKLVDNQPGSAVLEKENRSIQIGYTNKGRINSIEITNK
ncbi:M56 family metallopeptidase [Paenibacillus arenosi]|uniref:Peptidase M56 domain-containing protein n=1 Tax=Paenibacillus arenosi TaxID=2774142 RepID=A0ABR9AWD7_9BACL|nr:M56 family metallopeptidase [Paenibacillus arenosi]MBD8498451.1 hypothetical protein [Paenibacillus arenosi]